jgi:hypothetical protein
MVHPTAPLGPENVQPAQRFTALCLLTSGLVVSACVGIIHHEPRIASIDPCGHCLTNVQARMGAIDLLLLRIKQQPITVPPGSPFLPTCWGT